jgi:hypothetical protein
MAVLLQAAYEMNARCANPWPKETFSPGASESRIGSLTLQGNIDLRSNLGDSANALRT